VHNALTERRKSNFSAVSLATVTMRRFPITLWRRWAVPCHGCRISTSRAFPGSAGRVPGARRGADGVGSARGSYKGARSERGIGWLAPQWSVPRSMTAAVALQ